VVHLPERHELRRAAGGVERERAVVAEERLTMGRHEQDVAVACPAAHHHVGAEPRHAASGPAGRRHQIHLRVLLVAPDERELRAVGRQAWRRRLAQSGGEPARDTAGGANRPQVVVADENDRIALEGGLAQVALVAHGVLFRGVGSRCAQPARPVAEAGPTW